MYYQYHHVAEDKKKMHYNDSLVTQNYTNKDYI